MATTVDSSPQRNILIIGKIGAGKASIANAIVGEELFEIGSPMQRSRETVIECRSNFRIELINISSTQDDQNLQKKICDTLDSLKTFKLVLFVLKLEPVGIRFREIFEKVISHLSQDASTITAVIVTWCDLINVEGETKIKQELQEYLKLSQKEIRIIMVSLPRSEYVQESISSYVKEKREMSKKNLQALAGEVDLPCKIPSGKLKILYVHCTFHKYLFTDTIDDTFATEQSMEMEPSKTRNILIFGKIGTGKSTVANAILGCHVFPVGTSIDSTTRQAREVSQSGISFNGLTYSVTLVDTVDATDSHPSKSLQKRVENSIKKFESFNLILFVFKLERYTTQESESFQMVMKLLGSNQNASAVTALVVTCCEQKSEQAREKIKHQLRTSTNVAPFARKGIFLVGLPNLDEASPPLKQHYEGKKEEDEVNLQSLITTLHQEVSIHAAFV